MGSVVMPNPGVSTPDQALFSELSAPNMQAALQKASPGDLVQLSHEALQLQEANGLFGNPGTAPSVDQSTALDTMDALLLGLTSTSSSAAPASSAVSSSSAEAQLVNALFGVGPSASVADPTLNLLA